VREGRVRVYPSGEGKTETAQTPGMLREEFVSTPDSWVAGEYGTSFHLRVASPRRVRYLCLGHFRSNQNRIRQGRQGKLHGKGG